MPAGIHDMMDLLRGAVFRRTGAQLEFRDFNSSLPSSDGGAIGLDRIASKPRIALSLDGTSGLNIRQIL